MGVSFTKAYVLLILPILIIAVLYSGKWLRRMAKEKRRLLLVLRTLVLTFLVLALAGTSFYWEVDTTTTFFLIDASDSTKLKLSDMEEFVKEASKNKGPKDKIGVISFGDNAQVESFISSEVNFTKVEGNINSNYTNIENAIATTLSLFPSNSRKRIVLLSDGEENSGAISKIAYSIQQQGIDFKYFKIEKEIGEEVAVESINLPQKLILDEEFNLYVNINSTIQQKATLHLYSGRNKVGEQQVQLQKGINKYVFRDKADVGGFKNFKVVVEPEKDTEVKNNEASAFTKIISKPNILVIHENESESAELAKMLQASSLDYTVVNSKGAPSTLQEMTSYKTIISCNVSADNLNDGFLNSLESYVKDFGGGFIAIGGDNSFALGGYSRTSLETVLPVYMEMRGKKEVPKMSMILIIDKSGSMTEGMAGISKVDMAKEAAIRSLESLRPGKDEIGVIAFDGYYSWVVKRQIIEDLEQIEEDIASIRADGGTDILPALEAGFKSLKDSDAKLKHIILLTDGQSSSAGKDELLKKINEANITVSTVAVGKDADIALLKDIANICGGRQYITDEYTNIPRIFAKETFIAARSYLNNREFSPIVTSEHSILKGVADTGIPTLLGYVGASQKETARVLIKSDEEDPILTVWQYGLGKTVAWNSDLSGKWSANYISWANNLKLWQNIINFTLENYDNENVSMQVSAQGGKATIVFIDKKNQDELDTSAVVVSPSGENVKVKLYPTAPGEYTGSVDLKESGVYMINGKQEKNGETINAISTGYAMQYSPEYKINSEAGNKFDRLVTEIGGSIIKSPEEALKGEIPANKGQRDLVPYLLALALILLIFDIALRRLNISLYKIKEAFKKIKLSHSKNSYSKRKNHSKIKAKSNDDRHRAKVVSYNEMETVDIEKNTEEMGEQVNKVNIEDNTNKKEEKEASNILNTSQLLKNKKFKK